MKMARLLQALHLITMCIAREQAASSTTGGITPVGKAISMLKKMKAQGRAEMQEEEFRFAKFKRWCQDTEVKKNGEIEDGEVKMEQLKALVLRADAMADRLDSGIDRLNKQVGKLRKEEDEAAKEREKEADEYKASSKELKRSVEALEKAMAVIEEQAEAAREAAAKKAAAAEKETAESGSDETNEEADGAAFFLQVQSELADQNEDLAALLEVERTADSSSGVMDLLKKLKAGSSDQLRAVNMDEAKAKAAHSLLMSQLKTQIETAESELKEKKVDQAKALQEKKEAQLELSETRGDIEEDVKYLEDMKAMCSTKADDFEKRTAIRHKELEAINTAIGILTEKVTGLVQVAEGGFQLAQEHVASALAQLRSSSQRSDRLQAALVQFLKQRSASIHSVTLSVLSERVAADPLKNVKKMINDMIDKLEEELQEATEKKKFCDAELKENEATRTKKSEASEDLKLEIEDLNSQVVELGEDIKELKAAIVELKENVAEATKDRQESQAKNLKQIQEAGQAQAACDEAIVALREFYGKPSAFLQESTSGSLSEGPADDAPETFSSKYTGMGQSGVIDILEMASTQYASLKAEAEDAERKEADEFQTLTFEAKKDEALKENEIGHKQERKSRKELSSKQAATQLDETSEQLEKANKYFKELQEQCFTPPMSHEERVKQRQAEIDSMKEALTILEDSR